MIGPTDLLHPSGTEHEKHLKFKGETELLTLGNENVVRILEMRGFVLF